MRTEKFNSQEELKDWLDNFAKEHIARPEGASPVRIIVDDLISTWETQSNWISDPKAKSVAQRAVEDFHQIRDHVTAFETDTVKAFCILMFEGLGLLPPPPDDDNNEEHKEAEEEEDLWTVQAVEKRLQSLYEEKGLLPPPPDDVVQEVTVEFGLDDDNNEEHKEEEEQEDDNE